MRRRCWPSPIGWRGSSTTSGSTSSSRPSTTTRSFYDYQELLATDAVRWADDAEGLAAITGIDPEGLQASLDQAQACAAAATDPFGRAFWEAPLSGRLAAVKVTGALFHTQGGLLVDSSARVTAGGEPIPGLYAAGGAAVPASVGKRTSPARPGRSTSAASTSATSFGPTS